MSSSWFPEGVAQTAHVLGLPAVIAGVGEADVRDEVVPHPQSETRAVTPHQLRPRPRPRPQPAGLVQAGGPPPGAAPLLAVLQRHAVVAGEPLAAVMGRVVAHGDVVQPHGAALQPGKLLLLEFLVTKLDPHLLIVAIALPIGHVSVDVAAGRDVVSIPLLDCGSGNF